MLVTVFLLILLFGGIDCTDKLHKMETESSNPAGQTNAPIRSLEAPSYATKAPPRRCTRSTSTTSTTTTQLPSQRRTISRRSTIKLYWGEDLPITPLFTVSTFVTRPIGKNNVKVLDNDKPTPTIEQPINIARVIVLAFLIGIITASLVFGMIICIQRFYGTSIRKPSMNSSYIRSYYAEPSIDDRRADTEV